MLALDDVRYLSSDSLGGRLVGTPGADSAAAFIARRFKQSGLQASPVGWFQEFVVAKDAAAAGSAGIGGATGRNVIGVLPGRDPKLRNEIVIVGAHYDHLGLGKFGSLDPDSTGAVHNGADDNASGIAALFRIADTLAVMPPARTVVFIAFSGEEEGVLGSTWYVQHPVFPMASVTAMINLDMVGPAAERSPDRLRRRDGEAVPRPARLAQHHREVRPQGLGRRLRPERSPVVLPGREAGAPHLHRPARGLSPLDRRLGEDQRRRADPGGRLRRRDRRRPSATGGPRSPS